MIGSTTTSDTDQVYTANIKATRVDSNQQANPVPYISGEGWVAPTWIVSKIYNPKESTKKSGGKGSKGSGSSKNYSGDLAGLVALGTLDEWMEIMVNSDTIWAGSVGRDAPAGTGEYAHIVLDEGTFRLHWGTRTGTGDFIVLNSSDEEHPYYRDFAILEIKGLKFGSSDTPPNVMIRVGKTPRVSGLDQGRTREGVNPVTTLAEVMTNNFYGLGLDLLDPATTAALANTLKAQTQTVTLAGADHVARMGYQCITLTSRMSFQSFFQSIAENYDGWARYKGGKIELGCYPHDGVSTAGLPELTIHDFITPPAYTNPGFDDDSVITDAVVRGPDRDYYWDDSSQADSNPVTFARVEELRLKTFDRKFICTSYQQKWQSTQLVNYYARPGGTVSHDVRREKAISLYPGDRFILNYGPMSSRQVFRIKRRTEPSTGGKIKLDLELERALAPLVYVPAPDPAPLLPSVPGPEVITAARVLQVPAQWSGSPAPALLVLAARPAANTKGFRVYYSSDDASYDYLDDIDTWTVRAALTGDVATGATWFTLSLLGTNYDLSLFAAQSAAKALDNTLLLIVDQEIMSIVGVTALGGGSYNVAVLRGRLGSTVASHSALAEVHIVPREDCTLLEYAQFPRTTTGAWLKLASYTRKERQQLADAAKLAFTFADRAVGTAGDFTVEAKTEAVAIKATTPDQDDIALMAVYVVAQGAAEPASTALPSITIPVTRGVPVNWPYPVAAGVAKDYYARWIDSGSNTSAFVGPFTQTALAVPAGAPGTNGTNGSDGLTAVTIYLRSAVQPSTPTGNNPSGWTTARPTSGTGAIWASSGFKTLAGVLSGTWSTPVRESGSVTFTQSTDPALTNAVLPGDTWFDTSTPAAIQIKVRNTANNGWLNNTLASLAVSNLLSGTMTGINIEIVGGGRIRLTNGTVWLVLGTGFGSSNQFIMWFGPAQSSLSQCTEANAGFYLRGDGSGYFGGALSAGTLSNSIQTSDLSSTAQVTLGPFGTNGSNKLVTVSYAFDAYGATTSDNSDDASATVQLYRKIGTGAESLVATLTATGSTWANYEAEQVPHWVWSCHIGGSLTYTDNNASTADRTYRAVISSRSGATLGGTSTSQRVGIISVEQ